MYQNEQLARLRYQQDLEQADRRRLVRALQAQRRAVRQHRRADRALSRATHRLSTVTA